VEYYNSFHVFVSSVEREFRLGHLTAQQAETHLMPLLRRFRKGCHPQSLLRLIQTAEMTGNPGLVEQLLSVMDHDHDHVYGSVVIAAIRALKSLRAPLDVTKYPGINQFVATDHQIATEILSARRHHLESNGISKEIYNHLVPYFELWFDSRVLGALGMPVSGASDGSKLEPDVATVTVMLDAYLEQCQYEESVVKETHRRFNLALSDPDLNRILTGIGPGVFNVLIHAFASLNSVDIDACLSLTADINRLVTGGDEPLLVNNVLARKRHAGTDSVSLVVLLMALSWDGHLKAAEAVLKQIWRQYPASFDTASNVAISGYAKIGDEGRAQELAHLRELVGFPTDGFTKRALSGFAASDEALLLPPSLG
jgi:hypothetical protein